MQAYSEKNHFPIEKQNAGFISKFPKQIPNKILSVVPRWKKSGYPGAPDALSTSSRWKPIFKEIAGV